MRKIASFFKALLIGIFFIPLYPLIILIPRHKVYIFVITTGRSGSGALASLMGQFDNVLSAHEPYPILNNSFNLRGVIFRIWIAYQFYLIKLPLIYLSGVRGKDVYIETNHLFVKTFLSHASKVFGRRMGIVHLTRPVEAVARSMYQIGVIPGSREGNKWYLDPGDGNNFVNFDKVFSRIDDAEKLAWKDLYRCIWYWYEIEERARQCIDGNRVLSLEISDLDNPDRVSWLISKAFGVTISPLSCVQNIDRNLKSDEKKNPVSAKDVYEKVGLFSDALFDS